MFHFIVNILQSNAINTEIIDVHKEKIFFDWKFSK